MLAFALQVPRGQFDPMFAAEHQRLALNRRKHYFVQARAGIGWHQLGGTTNPIGGPTYHIHTYTVTGGVILKQQLKLSAGLSYRYYDSFYHYIMNTPNSEWATDPAFYRKHPKWNSTNIILFLGGEFLVGHIGLEINEGLNLFKPFYREFNIRWDFNRGSKYWRSRYLATRLGINYYFLNTSRMPRNNFWIGTHINANYNKADFLEVSAGYSFKIR